MDFLRSNPIIFIDDDTEDLELMKEMAIELCFPNQIITFNKPEAALDFLLESGITPLFIISDINMPKLTGFQLRNKLLNAGAVVKDIPFLLFSTSRTEMEVSHAEELEVLRFYKKSISFTGIKETFESIGSLFNIGTQA